MAAVKQKTARGSKQDRARVAGGQKYEVQYEAKKSGRSAAGGKTTGRQGPSAHAATPPGAQRHRDDPVRWRARFFLKLMPSAAKKRDSIDLSASTPCARSRRSAIASSVRSFSLCLGPTQ